MNLQPSRSPVSNRAYTQKKPLNLPRLNIEEIKKRLKEREQELIEESTTSFEETGSEEVSYNEDFTDPLINEILEDRNINFHLTTVYEESPESVEKHCSKRFEIPHKENLHCQNYGSPNSIKDLTQKDDSLFHLTTVHEQPFELSKQFKIANKENIHCQNHGSFNSSKDFTQKDDSLSRECKKKNDSFDLDLSALTINTPIKKKPEALLMPKINIVPSTPKNNFGTGYENKLHTPLTNLSQKQYCVSGPMFKTPQNKPVIMPTSYSARKLPTMFQNAVRKTPIYCKTLPESGLKEANFKPSGRSCNFRGDEFNRLRVNNVEYLVMRPLGKGGSSEVFYCFNPESRQDVAIKCVSLSNNETATGYINEVELLESLQQCDKIIKMHSYEILRSEEKLLVVLEKGGEDLSAILKQQAIKQNHLPMYMVLFYWMEMLYAVEQIHMKGVIHSDLKPANFLRAEGGLKLIDFGIASKVQEDMTCVYKSYQEGSSNYISPEAVVASSQVNSTTLGKPKYEVHYKSDVWSLGCILYQLVYRYTPFQHYNPLYAKLAAITNPNHKIEYPPSNWVPQKIINTIKKCLQHDIKARPSVSELIKEYEYSSSIDIM